VITEKDTLLILVVGLLMSTISILLSVDFLFQKKQYIELIVTAILFGIIVILIRHFKMKYQLLTPDKHIEKSSITS